MRTRRKHLGAAVIDNLVYVVGGRDERSELSSAERQAKRPKIPQPQTHAHTRTHTHTHTHTQTYTTPHTKGTVCITDRYDPAADSWETVTAMNCRRSGIGLGVVNGKLYSAGGFDGSMYLKTVECFDLLLKQWKPVGSMNYQRLGCGVGVVTLTTTNSTNINI